MKRVLALFFLITAFTGTTSWADDYYIEPSGNDVTGDGSTGTPWKTLDKVWSTIDASGNTVFLKDGVYDYSGMEFDANMDKGASWSSSITIRAVNPFAAVIKLNNALNMGSAESTYYMKIEGLVFDYPAQKAIGGHEWYFKNVGFKGGATSGNSALLIIGNNDFSGPGATNGILEDIYLVGYSTASGRYTGLVYNSRDIVIRRAVSYLGDGWDDGGSANPSANFTFYNSQNVGCLNCFATDTNAPPDTYQAQFYFVNNSGQPQTGDTIHVLGSGAYNSASYAVYFDNTLEYSSVTFRNFVVVDSSNVLAGGYSGAVGFTFDQFTFIRASYTASGGDVALYGSAGTKIMTNGIIAGFTDGWVDGSDSILTYYDWNNSGTAPVNTGEQTYNPRENGLVYFTRTEDGSNLAGDGTGGKKLGAQIVNKIGIDGKFFGDTDWMVDTGELLWPYPNQDQIKGEMCASYSHGLCSAAMNGKTLTDYFVGLGTNPYGGAGVDTSSPTAPTGISTTAVTSASITFEWTASVSTDTTTYEIDVDDDPAFGSLLVDDSTIGNVTSYEVTGLASETTYYIRIRAKDGAGNTSSNSESGNGTTDAEAAPASSSAASISLGDSGSINWGSGSFSQ